MQSQILRELDVICTTFINANRKKGSKKVKPQDQLQPKYVEEAKKNLRRKDAEAKTEQRNELAEFFEQKNNGTKRLESNNGA